MKSCFLIASAMLSVGLVAFSCACQASATEELDNIAKPMFEAIMLPSSQAMSVDLQVEKAMDGDPATSYVTAPGTYPNWVEVRWPQPVTLSRIVVDEDAVGRSAEYRVDALVDNKWVQVVGPKANTFKPGEPIDERFPAVETMKIRYYMLSPDGDPSKTAGSIRELQVYGHADWIDAAKCISKPNWKSHWIWYPEDGTGDVTRYIRRHVQVDDLGTINDAFLQISVDDSFEVRVNGNYVGIGGIATNLYDVKKFLVTGDNVIAVRCYQGTGFEGLIAELALNKADGSVERIVSDSSWNSRKEPIDDWYSAGVDETGWQQCKEQGIPPNCPDHTGQNYFDVGAKEVFTCKLLSVTPTKVKPGSRVQMKLELSVDSPVKNDYGIIVRIGEKPDGNPGWNCDYMVASKQLLPEVSTTSWVPGKKYVIPVSIYIPDWAPHGDMPISVEVVGKNVAGKISNASDGVVGTVRLQRFAKDPKPWPAVFPGAAVKMVGGQPKLFVKGKIVAPFIMTENSVPSYRAFGEHAKSGAKVWRVVGLKWLNYDHGSSDDVKDDEQYLKSIDQQVNALLRVDPDAYIIVCSLLRASKLWTDTHPDDAVLLANGNRISESLSSRKWCEALDGDYTLLVKHMMAQRYAGHVIGIQYEMAGETYWPGHYSNTYTTPREKLIVGDYSPEHVRAFRIWLKDRYKGDVQALQLAWKDDSVTFDTAAPDINVFRQEDLIAFRDPAKTRMPMDYWEFHAGVMAQRTIDVGKTIKEASGGKLICGLWGFYSNGMMAASYAKGIMHHSGYLGLKKVLDSPYVDYIVALQSYSEVRWGTPMIPVNLAESIVRHGKILLVEYDVRTFFTMVHYTERTYSQPETLSVERRDVAAAALRNYAFWWVGFPDGTQGRISVPWSAEESILSNQNSAREIYDAAYNYGGSQSVSQIAVFMNNADVYGLDLMYAHKLLVSAQHNVAYRELPRLGVPIDYYLLEDVALDNMDQYKVYVFANAFTLSKDQRDLIKSKLLRAGKTLVWLYAPGFSDGTKLSVDNIQDLTGFTVGYDSEALCPQVNVETGHEFTVGATPDERVLPHRWTHDPDPDYKFGPIFYVNDPAAETLGKYAHNGKVAYAIKQVNKANSIYMAVPFITTSVMREISKAAGVHLYTAENEFVDASKNYLLITTGPDGCNKTISLPAPCTVYDIWNKKVIGTALTSFQANIPALDTGFYFTGTDAQVKAFTQRVKSGE